MFTIKNFLLVSLLLVVGLVGCAPSDDEITETAPTSVPFEGQTDNRFTGKWKTSDGARTYSFLDSGEFKLDGTIKNRDQVIPMKTQGSWKVKGDRLLIKDENKNVVPYVYKFTGNTLSLTLTGSMKNETVLTKA